MGCCNVLQLWLIITLIQCLNGLRFTVEPADSIVAYQHSLLLPCQAKDDTAPIQYSWTFNSDTDLPLHENHVVFSNGSLLIRRVTPDDVGDYTCTAKTGETTLQSSTAWVQLAYISPTFSSQPVSQSVILGDNVTLSCHIDSLPTANITWILDGVDVNSGLQQQADNRTSYLTLFPVMYHHAGTYKCVGTNPVIGVKRYSNDATIVVQGQPVFVSSPKPVTVPLHFDAKFVCGFHGNPAPTVTWFLHTSTEDGDISSIEIQTSEKYRVYDNGTFIIYNATKADVAFYTCNVGNVFGEISMSASLTVSGEATAPVFTVDLHNVTVMYEDTVSIQCGCEGNPVPDIRWNKGTDVISTNGSLYIDSATSKTTGWYTCNCENPVTAVWQSVYIDVYVPPRITRYSQDVRVKKFDPLFIHCQTVGNPLPTVTWNTPRFGEVNQSGDGLVLYENGTLQVISTSLDDTGSYTCMGGNVAGSVTATCDVTVETVPSIITLPISQGVRQGTSVYLHCQATGIPAPSYSWSKDGVGTITSTSAIQIFMNNTLVIHSVSKHDEGVYRCRVNNIHGNTEAVATVTVTIPPYFITSPDNQTVTVGSDVQLACLSEGDPVPTQRWNFNDKQLFIDDETMSLNMDQSTLQINQIKKSQFGKYTCVATNIAGISSVSAWVNLYDIPVFTITPENMIVNESSSMTLQCQGQAIEAPSVTWYRDTSGERTQIVNDERITVGNNGSLHIKNILEQYDEGWYVCVVANSAGNISQKVFVNVQVSPVITFTNSPQSAVEGSAVNLVCQSTGDPTPIIQWIHPSGVIIQSNSSYLITGHTLNIASTNEDDNGNWTCQYCNQLGCDSAILQIITEGSPVITSFNGIQDGSLVTLQCEVEGIPTPTVTFTSQGQTVTSDLQGHLMRNNRLLIDKENIRQEYKCIGNNEYGTAVKSVQVPSHMEPPTIVDINARSVTLLMTEPVGMGNLPFTKFAAQLYTDLDPFWKPIDGQGQKSWKVTGLQPYAKYYFRVAAENILGPGVFSSPTTIKTLPDVPSPPVDVVTLELADNVILLQWQPSQHLNGPKADVVYEYKITKPMRVEDSDTVIIIKHIEGTLLHNDTLQVRLTDLTEPVLYSAIVFARNMKINKSSEPVIITIDQTKLGAGLPEAEPHSDDQTFGTDKVIGVVLGSVGGVFLVIIIVFIVTRIRHQKKSESLSLVEHRLSLDKFYMENPKNLYNDTKYSSLRKSCHSFYSFDQDDSFHSNNGNRDSLNGSVIHIGGKRKSCEVILVSKNPLYEDRNVQLSTEHNKLTEGSGYKESCEQSEIQIPTHDVSVDNIHTDNSQSEPIDTDKHNDVTNEPIAENPDIYSSIGTGRSKSSTPDTSLEHIYSSIQNDDRLSRHSASSSSIGTNKLKGDNQLNDAPSDKVASLDNCGRKSHYIKGQGQWKNTTPRARNTRSASPEHCAKGSNSACLKAPTRVLSLDLLSPSVKRETNMAPSKRSELRILAGNTRRDNCTDKTEVVNDCDKVNDSDSEHTTVSDLNTVNNCCDIEPVTSVDTEQQDEVMGKETKCDKILGVNSENEKTFVTCKEKEENSSTNGDSNIIEESGLVIYDTPPVRRPKNVIDDNFLTEEDIKRDSMLAELY